MRPLATVERQPLRRPPGRDSEILATNPGRSCSIRSAHGNPCDSTETGRGRARNLGLPTTLHRARARVLIDPQRPKANQSRVQPYEPPAGSNWKVAPQSLRILELASETPNPVSRPRQARFSVC